MSEQPPKPFIVHAVLMTKNRFTQALNYKYLQPFDGPIAPSFGDNIEMNGKTYLVQLRSLTAAPPDIVPETEPAELYVTIYLLDLSEAANEMKTMKPMAQA